MRISRLLLVTLLISGLLAPQALAETELPAETNIIEEPSVPSVSPVITAGGASQNASQLSTVTSIPATVFPSGTYTAGTDIPAGEYILLLDHTSSYGYYCIGTNDSEDAEYIDYNSFDYNAIIRLENGQELALQGCSAAPMNEVPKIDYFYGNMYKIGYHIPAGTYRLKALDSASSGIAYVLSYPSDNYDVVEDYTYVDGTAAITVMNGQYLQLDGCILAGTASASDVAKDHGSTSDSLYEDGDMTGETSSGDDNRSSLINAGSLIPGLPTATSVPSTIYQPGTYQAGIDIPAGEYVLFMDSSDLDEYSYGGLYAISTVREPESMDQLTDYGTLQYNCIVTVEEGQFLILSSCTASPIGQVPELDYREANYFKVGYHIPAGTYHFKLTGTYGAAYILSAPSQSSEDVVDYDFGYLNKDTFSLTMEDGQYLFISGCIFISDTEAALSGGPGGKGSDSSSAANYTDYLKQLFGYEEDDGAEETTSPVITAPRGSEALSSTTSVPSTIYPAGLYEAGVDIPAGEYMLLCPDSGENIYGYSTNASYIISSTRETDDPDNIIDYNSFSYNAIIQINDGQFLSLSDCAASPISEVPQLDYSRGEMYKVGLQLPAGSYRLEVSNEASYGLAYILSYPSDNYEDVVESFTVRNGEGTVITVANGQYLQLKRCVVTAAASGNSSSGPAFDLSDEKTE